MGKRMHVKQAELMLAMLWRELLSVWIMGTKLSLVRSLAYHFKYYMFQRFTKPNFAVDD